MVSLWSPELRGKVTFYNWWSWYVRLAHPKTRLEAITSRPLLLSGVARLTRHAGQSRLLLTLIHAAGNQIKSMIANIRGVLSHVLASTPQLPKSERWPALAPYIASVHPTYRSETHLCKFAAFKEKRDGGTARSGTLAGAG